MQLALVARVVEVRVAQQVADHGAVLLQRVGDHDHAQEGVLEHDVLGDVAGDDVHAVGEDGWGQPDEGPAEVDGVDEGVVAEGGSHVGVDGQTVEVREGGA